MCLTFCHRRDLLFDSDTDNVCGVCSFNFQDDKACDACVHQSGEPTLAAERACALAHAPQPARRWCCHCNVQPKSGWRGLDSSGKDLRGHLRRLPLAHVLEMYGAEYQSGEPGEYTLNLDSLAVPLVYGVPVEHWTNAIRRGLADEARATAQSSGLPGSEGPLGIGTR
jgi:hypothetical protein